MQLRKRAFPLAIAVALVLTACVSAPAAPAPPSTARLTGRITFAGSTTVQPLAGELGQAFNARHPDAQLEIAAGGSSVGIKAIHDGTVDIGMASRNLKPEEAEGLTSHQIAVDVIAVVVHQNNPVKALTSEELQAIYLGEITNWGDVGGPDQGILVVVRDVNSGTRGAFDEIVLDKQEPNVPQIAKALTAGDMAALVSENPQAIGYVGFGNIEAGLQVVTIDGVVPSEETARSGAYRLTRPLFLLTGPLTQPLAQTFVDFAQSPAGQEIVAASGWVTVSEP